MGSMYSAYVTKSDTTPKSTEQPTFDAQYGFEQPRAERKMVATLQEMQSASLTVDQRDYCAHTLIDFLHCKRGQFPWVVRCKAEKHAHEQCQVNDYIVRMKEYEREKRLRERRKRLDARQSTELLAA